MKMKKGYTTSTLTTHKDRASEIIGTCGPCSFINLVGLKGSFELEKKLAESGRMKPFYMSNFTSYLIWAEQYNKDLIVYTSNTKISEDTFKTIFKYEKIEQKDQQKLKKQCLKRYTQILKRNKKKIKQLKVSPLEQIDKLLDTNHRVAFNVYVKADNNADENSLHIGHLRVCYKKENEKYFIYDSYYGNLRLSKEEMKKSLDKVKENGASYDIVGYKE